MNRLSFATSKYRSFFSLLSTRQLRNSTTSTVTTDTIQTVPPKKIENGDTLEAGSGFNSSSHAYSLKTTFSIDDQKRVVVVGIRGLITKSSGGIGGLVDYMRDRLTPYGVPSNNFFNTKWHHSDSGSDPETSRHWNEVVQRSNKPILFILGHSLGGWSAARLANKAHEEGADVRYVGLIDARYNITTPGEPFAMQAGYVENFYQKRGTSVFSYCLKDMLGDLVGHHNPHAHYNEKISFKHIWDGDNNVKKDREDCYTYDQEKWTSHTDIDSDKKVWLSVRRAIMSRLNFAVVTGEIKRKWESLGGADGILGSPTTNEMITPDKVGRYNHFRRLDGAEGSIYWTPSTGAYEVHGQIRDKWIALGWENGLGYPITDQMTTPDEVGRYNHFRRLDGAESSIYWTPSTGAYEVHGQIRDKWIALGWENRLGYPITDEMTTPDGVGRYNHFRRLDGAEGSIYWTPSTGAYEVHGQIRDKWIALGWEKGLGYPITDEMTTPDEVGRYNHFRRLNGAESSIYWTPSTGAYEVHGQIRDKWIALGWENGLGYPITDEMTTPDEVGRYNHFRRLDGAESSIYWTPETGAYVVYGVHTASRSSDLTKLSFFRSASSNIVQSATENSNNTTAHTPLPENNSFKR